MRTKGAILKDADMAAGMAASCTPLLLEVLVDIRDVLITITSSVDGIADRMDSIKEEDPDGDLT